MTDIIEFERFQPLAEEDGTISRRLAEYLEEMTRQVNFNTVASGSGSPESVLTADPNKLYMDTAGSAGSILYIKKSGTSNTGWILV